MILLNDIVWYDVPRKCLPGKGRPTSCSLSSFLLPEVLQHDLKGAAARGRDVQLLHGLQKPKYDAYSSSGWQGHDWQCWTCQAWRAGEPEEEEVSWDARAGCEEARLRSHLHISSPYHRISWNIISIWFDILCSSLCFRSHVLWRVSRYIMWYHCSWYQMIYRDIAVCVLGLGPWSGGVISCVIMRYHVGWTAWSARLKFGVISYYIILYHVSISCPYIIKNVRWYWMILNDTKSRRKKDDMSIYHVSSRDNDISIHMCRWQWYTMIHNDRNVICDDI
jgi:hypothetical protein